jgi:hypothetical protein
VEDPHLSEKVIAAFVKPIYLTVHMDRPFDLGQALRLSELARQATIEEVQWMLATHWRPRRVGAWFTLVHSGHELDAPLLESLRTSQGTLTAPELGFAAARRLGSAALPALHEYQAVAARHEFGGLSEITALIEYLGDSSEIAPSNESARESVSNRHVWAYFIESA